MLTVTARTLPDLIGTLPATFGFVPTESVVMVELDRPADRPALRARLDLPTDEPADVIDAANALHSACRHNNVGRVILVAFTETTEPGTTPPAVDALAAWLRNGDVDVVDVVTHARGFVWSDTQPDVTPVDWHDTDTARELAAAGMTAAQSRAEALNVWEPAEHPLTAEQIDTARTMRGFTGPLAKTSTVAALTHALDTGHHIADPTAAAILDSLDDPDARDKVWMLLTTDNAPAAAKVLTNLATRAPAEHAAHVTVLAGFAWWLAGNGAQAYEALDRARQADDTVAAGILAVVLDEAVPPSLWAKFRADVLDLDTV